MPFSQNQIWREFRQDWITLILWLWLEGDRARKSCVSSDMTKCHTTAVLVGGNQNELQLATVKS